MATVHIDGKPYEAGDGKNMLEVVLDHKLDLPYFCWHPAMGSVGACRICAVRVFKDENDTKGKIEMACMTPAKEGTRISVSDSEAAEFRRKVIEWLMINHPHDCPVCDEGGECHLQDMTVLTGHVYREYDGKKRTYTNQDLGPFVTHEMNRCIQCYRCVRFYRDHAGGSDLNVFASKNRVYFGRDRSGVLESEFSGNLVEVCPTGVFTDKSLYSHYTRKWDLETAPSVCVHCSLGCNTIPGARYGLLRRIRSRYNSDVNTYFLCDRGRYGYEYVNDERRIRVAGVGKGGGRTEVMGAEALAAARYALSNAKGLVGIGSPRASVEANYALKTLVGDGGFSTGLSEYDQAGAELALKILQDGSARTPSLAEVAEADVVLVLGADPTNEAPMLDYFIRQAMKRAALGMSRELKIPDWDAQAVNIALNGAKGKLYVLPPWRTKIEQIATDSARATPADLAGFGGQILDRIASNAEPSDDDLMARVASDLRSARQPLVVTSISAGTAVLQTAANITSALHGIGKECWISIILPEANTMGQVMLEGMSVDEALGRLKSGLADTVIVLQNDLQRRVDPDLLRESLGKATNIIVLDCITTCVTDAADIVIPVRTHIECDGTFVNNEGRAQRFFQAFIPHGDALTDWAVLRDLAGKTEWRIFEDILRDLASSDPAMAGVLEAAPPADWRSSAGRKIPRETHRYTGRTAKDADRTMFEPTTPDDPDTPFAFTMEGDQNPAPGPLVQRLWWPGWNSENSVTKFQQEVDGPPYGGNSGKRLIEPSGGGSGQSAEDQPVPGQGTVTIVPRAFIFGSEELSRLSEGIQQLTPEASLAVNRALAEKLGLSEGQRARFSDGGSACELPVRIDDSLPPDTATVPAGYPETAGIVRPVKSEITPIR